MAESHNATAQLGIIMTGDAALLAQMEEIARTMPEAVGVPLYAWAEEIMTESKTNYVPVDTGALRGSGYVTPPQTDGLKTFLELGFGGSAIGYAAKVHEDLTAHHNVGQAKYLEVPLLQGLGKLQAEIAKHLESVLREKPA